MIVIPLQAIPNQSLSIQIGVNNFDLDIHSCNNTPNSDGTAIMTLSVVLNNVDIIDGQRMVPAWPLIGYAYLENGNFFIITENDEYADYTQFGITQFLVYATQQEIDAITAGTFVNVGS